MPRPWPWGSARRGWNARESSSSRASSGRLLQQQERQENERSTLAKLQPVIALETLEERAALARDAGQKAAGELQELLAEISVARTASENSRRR